MSLEELLAWLKKIFFRNGRWKVLAVLIAGVVYFQIRSGISDVRTITVPVEIDPEVKESNAKDGAVIASYDPPSVQVTVRGSFNDVNQAGQNVARCLLRPRWRKGAIEDSLKIEIGRSNFRGISRALNILKIVPEKALVHFDIPMSLQLLIAPPVLEGKARGRVEFVCGATNAIIRGSQRLLKTMDKEKVQVQSEPINVDGRAMSYTVPVKLIPPGDVPNATVDPPTMDVTVKIISETDVRHMEHGRIRIVMPFTSTARWKVEPEWVDYDIKGRTEIVNAVTDGQILFSVDAMQPFAADFVTNEVPVRIHIQQGLAIDEVTVLPHTVKLISLPPAPPTGTPDSIK